MIPAYQFFPQLFLRTPILSHTDYRAGNLVEPLQNPAFRLALYLASAGFYQLLEAKEFNAGALNEKERHTLGKYYNRMSFRPTPFAGFSSFTLTAWGEGDQIVLPGPENTLLHVLPDQQAATAIAKLINAAASTGTYHLNPSLYRAGREFRFIKTSPGESGTRLRYSLESFEANPLTRALCCFLGNASKSGQEITAFVHQKTGCENHAAADYLQFLAGAQVILPAAGMNITGEDYLRRIARQSHEPVPGLQDLAATFSNLPRDTQRLTPRVLENLERHFKQFLTQNSEGRQPGEQQPAHYFYANTERKALKGSLSLLHQYKLQAALSVLAKLAQPAGPGLLQQFATAFNQRFESRKIPLLQALDPDTGVGYGNLAEQAGIPALLKDLRFPEKEHPDASLPWSAVHRLLLKKWNPAGKDRVIRLEAKDVEHLQDPPVERLPPGIAVMFRPTSQGLFIESTGGVTGTSLIGRFTPFSAAVHQFAREIAATESAANPGILFAEIGQLSDTYTDNVNRRQYAYDHEIPVNSISLLPPDRQIQPTDLLVSVRNREVILESRRLRKRIIPRLSSAYNFRHNDLALYRFLCDLQYQGVYSNFGLDPETFFPGMPHYPRVEYQGMILSAAKWHIDPEDFGAAPEELREKLQLPPLVALTRFDQQLVFDLDNPQQARLFDDCLDGTQSITLQEFFLPETGHPDVVNASGKALISQYIAFTANRQAVYQPVPFIPPVTGKVKREFIPGSQWLYLKVYCTPALADELLVKKILPVISKVLRQGPASWFFIRYTDPGPHIRLRVRISEERTGEVLALFKAQFSGLVSQQLIREYQADTYRSEVERYGPDLIGSVEQVFRASSDLVIHFIKNNESAGHSTDHFAISSFALILHILIPVPEEQLRFLKTVSSAFYTELHGDKSLRVGIDQLYRGMKQEFATAVNDPQFYHNLGLKREYKQLWRVISDLQQAIGPAGEKRRHDLAADLIHMHLNRTYRDRQRQQEMVLYHCFLKYKLSQSAISGKSPAGVSPALEQPFLHGT